LRFFLVEHAAIQSDAERQLRFAVELGVMHERVAGVNEHPATDTDEHGGVTRRGGLALRAYDAAVAEQVDAARKAELGMIGPRREREPRVVRERRPAVVDARSERLAPRETRRVLGVRHVDASARKIDESADMIDVEVREHDIADIVGAQPERAHATERGVLQPHAWRSSGQREQRPGEPARIVDGGRAHPVSTRTTPSGRSIRMHVSDTA
jgi:hypothetical protein